MPPGLYLLIFVEPLHIATLSRAQLAEVNQTHSLEIFACCMVCDRKCLKGLVDDRLGDNLGRLLSVGHWRMNSSFHTGVAYV